MRRQYEVQRLLEDERYNARASMGPVVNEMSEQGSERPASAMVEDRNGEDAFLRKVQSLRAGLTESDKVGYDEFGQPYIIFGSYDVSRRDEILEEIYNTRSVYLRSHKFRSVEYKVPEEDWVVNRRYFRIRPNSSDNR